MKTIQIIGVGNVGSQVAFGLLCRFRGIRIVLTDKDRAVQEAQHLDLASANMLLNRNRLVATDTVTYANIYVVAVGYCSRGKSRDSLLSDNLPICREIFERIAQENPDAWVLVVTNPSHKLAQEGLMHLQKVIPVGKALDRTRTLLSSPIGTHESPWNKDVYQAIISGKDHTAFGPAGEVLKIVEEIVS